MPSGPVTGPSELALLARDRAREGEEPGWNHGARPVPVTGARFIVCGGLCHVPGTVPARRTPVPDAPLGRAHDGRGGAGDVPRSAVRDRSAHRQRLLLRLPVAARADAGRPARDRGPDARTPGVERAVRTQRDDEGGGTGAVRRTAVQGGADRGDRRREGVAVQAGGVSGPVRGTARRTRGAGATVQAGERR